MRRDGLMPFLKAKRKFGTKYGNGKSNGLTSWKEGLKEDFKVQIHLHSFPAKLKKGPNWTTIRHDAIHGFWFKNSRPFTADWIDA